MWFLLHGVQPFPQIFTFTFVSQINEISLDVKPRKLPGPCLGDHFRLLANFLATWLY